MPNSRALRAIASIWRAEMSSAGSSFVGTLWSIVASVSSGRRTLRFARRRPSKACGLVTSWTRCRSTYSRLSATSWSSQILSKRVRGIVWSAPAQPGGDDGQDGRLAGAGVLEVVRQVGVEGDAVAGGQLVALAVDVEHHGAVLDEGDLAAAGLVHRRVAGAAGLRAGRQRVAAELGALAGQRRGED